jgi:hypothetical protein
MSDMPKIIINGEEVQPGKKARLSDKGMSIDEVVRKARDEADKKTEDESE